MHQDQCISIPDSTSRPPKECEICGESYMPLPNNYSKARRCPTCATARRKSGSSSRPSKRSRPADYNLHRFWFFDGEGLTDPVSGWHRYVFMAAVSTDYDIMRLRLRPGQKRLRTYDMLWFLWKIPGHWRYGYSLSYDWTNILIDLPKTTLKTLFSDDREDPFEPVWWRGFGLIYKQHTLTIQRYINGKIAEKFYGDLYRCLGGGTFVKVLTDWNIGTREDRRAIADEKEKRSNFSTLTPAVEYYCVNLECYLGAQLARTWAAEAAKQGITPQKWYSAGSGIKHLMRHRHHVQDHRGPDRYAGAGPELRVEIMRGFSGGRFELSEPGIHPEVYSYDLASAYPSIMINLPCLAHGIWKDDYVEGGLNLCRIKWDAPTTSRWGPFPYRNHQGGISYPSWGEGTYWEPLVKAARGLKGYTFDEQRWWSYVPQCDHKPFAFIKDMYSLRLEWGKGGRGLVIKVTMNSGYGVTGDTISVSSDVASAIWAGLITSSTQALIVEQLALHGDDVLMIATDGIFTRSPVMGTAKVAKKDERLGTWTFKDKIVHPHLIQPGFFMSPGLEGIDADRTRGHGFRDVKAMEDAIRDAWLQRGWDGELTYPRRRFIPAKAALTRKEYEKSIAQWLTTNTRITFTPVYRHIASLPQNGIGLTEAGGKAPLNQYILGKDPVSAPYRKLRLLEMTPDMQDLILDKELENAQP